LANINININNLATHLKYAEFHRNIINRYVTDDSPTCLDIQMVTLHYVTLHNPFSWGHKCWNRL